MALYYFDAQRRIIGPAPAVPVPPDEEGTIDTGTINPANIIKIVDGTPVSLAEQPNLFMIYDLPSKDCVVTITGDIDKPKQYSNKDRGPFLFRYKGVYDFSSVTDVDTPLVLDRTLVISRVRLIRRNAGSEGRTECNVYADGGTIFQETDELAVTASDGDNATVVIEVHKVYPKGTRIDVSGIDSEAGSPSDLTVQVEFSIDEDERQ